MNIARREGIAAVATPPAREHRVPPGSLRKRASDLATAVIMALLAVTFALSHAALIFSGPLAAIQAYGVTVALVTSLVVGLAVSAFSSLRFATGGGDGNVAAVLAAGAATVAAALGAAGPDVTAATIVAGLALSSLVVGLVLVVLGYGRLGSLARYVPYPVIAGFLGATGLFLVMGGLGVGAHTTLREALVDQTPWPQSFATIAVAAAFLAARYRLKHPMALAGVLSAAIGVHWAGFALAGLDANRLAADGWVLALPTKLPSTVLWHGDMLSAVSWQALGTIVPTLIPVCVVTIISILFSVSALESVSRREADINRELAVAGAGSIVSGALGGMVGYHSYNRSLLAVSAGVDARWVGLLAAGLAGMFLLNGAILAAVPRPVLGGLVVFLGVQLLRDHVLASRRILSNVEWLTVLFILAVTAALGFAAGVFVGLMISSILFAVVYSRISPVRGLYTGSVARSSIERSEAEAVLLVAEGKALLIAHVQGYLFFGTANRLSRQIKDEIRAAGGQIRHLILDFAACEGMDGSAAISLERLARSLSDERIALCLTGLPVDVRDRFGSRGKSADAPLIFDTLDDALAWSESERLSGRVPDPREVEPFEALFAREFGDAELARMLIARLEPVELAPGDVLMQQGEVSDALYMLEQGRAVVLVQVGETLLRVRTFGPGTLVGEIGFVLGEPRTATIAAETSCRLLRLDRNHADTISREEPRIGLAFQSFLSRRLCLRIRDKDALIEALVRSAPRRRERK